MFFATLYERDESLEEIFDEVVGCAHSFCRALLDAASESEWRMAEVLKKVVDLAVRVNDDKTILTSDALVARGAHVAYAVTIALFLLFALTLHFLNIV